MLDLQMSYQQDRNEDGQIVFKLEPQLDVFIHYEGKRASDMPAARYNLRQLVARELEAENLRRTGGDNENAAGTRTGKTASEIHNAYKKGAEPDEGVKAGKDGVSIPNCPVRGAVTDAVACSLRLTSSAGLSYRRSKHRKTALVGRARALLCSLAYSRLQCSRGCFPCRARHEETANNVQIPRR